MVRAILAGKKTMTRRAWKAHFKNWKVGDRLWVRETYCTYLSDKTDGEEPEENYVSRWRPSIFMPRKYSRILLEITDLTILLTKAANEDNPCISTQNFDDAD